MSRLVCFFDEDGQTGICLRQETDKFDCLNCPCNPFPDKIVPEDRVLKKEIHSSRD